ncbi:hypothetical protein Pure05_42640 [Paenarthrobacter ureafaciens]|nr:hypothetical protein Pure01_42630 [Paenarthrobacter ureafaciens]GLU66024.1 hypothetical protein Pure02_42740 [Paenarthrobacter ureafaciens]GLU70285.1 hypothetical protein Pure03_42610 [Paenarthrobacter ureafaciens]GLU74560.1 hypothetical protein Pure04_42750 [Paenarthrobacter ureafaciens]GLU78824.1 hypothetical protein Pure05_42640 [Paenarthrobacter ureafaciens]
MLRHTHPSRATGPLVFNDTNSIPHQPRRADILDPESLVKVRASKQAAKAAAKAAKG